MTKTKVIKLNRIALFVIYFWFGILKLVNLSPANPLVNALLAKTMPFISPETFFVLLGLFELTIAGLFLFGKPMKLLTLLVSFHIITTFMPLILLPQIAWQSPFVPTIEGQYIIKNLLIISGLITLNYLSKAKE